MPQIFDKFPRISYSSDLHQHLKGLDLKCESYGGTNIYAWVTFWILLISLILAINYYYVLFNRPKMAKWWVWLINMLMGGIITFFMAYLRANADLNHSNYCKELHFNSADCLLFGLTAFTYTSFLFFIFSMIIKWKSLNNKKIPF
jgi:hypothetical protein